MSRHRPKSTTPGQSVGRPAGFGTKWSFGGALGPANRIAVIDAGTHQVTKYLLVGHRVWHMALTPDGKFLLSTNGLSNDVSVIDVASLKVIKTIQVGELPWGIAIARE